MTTLVLGAAGVIGGFIATGLAGRGLAAIAAARRFTPAERAQFGAGAREIPIARLDTAALARVLEESAADVVVNCLGVLQDNAGDSTHEVHLAFVERLIVALRAVARPILLVHLSIPGAEADDRTSFSRTKRVAEQAIANSGLPYAILRPGFVFAPRAFGGGAMMRALAALPIDLPAALASRAFSAVAMGDIAETIYFLVQRWQRPDPHHAAIWELMHPAPSTIGDVVAGLRIWLGAAWRLRVPLPMRLLKLAAVAWRPSTGPRRRPPTSTLDRRLGRSPRGVSGDRRVWTQSDRHRTAGARQRIAVAPGDVQEQRSREVYLLEGADYRGPRRFLHRVALIAIPMPLTPACARDFNRARLHARMGASGDDRQQPDGFVCRARHRVPAHQQLRPRWRHCRFAVLYDRRRIA